MSDEPNHVTAYMQAHERREDEAKRLYDAGAQAVRDSLDREQRRLEALETIAHELKRIADHVCGTTKTQSGTTIVRHSEPPLGRRD